MSEQTQTPRTTALIDRLYNSKLNMAELLAAVETHAIELEAETLALRAEVERLNGIITGVFPETAVLHEILNRAGCVSVSRADYDELQRLRSALAKAKDGKGEK